MCHRHPCDEVVRSRPPIKTGGCEHYPLSELSSPHPTFTTIRREDLNVELPPYPSLLQPKDVLFCRYPSVYLPKDVPIEGYVTSWEIITGAQRPHYQSNRMLTVSVFENSRRMILFIYRRLRSRSLFGFFRVIWLYICLLLK